MPPEPARTRHGPVRPSPLGAGARLDHLERGRHYPQYKRLRLRCHVAAVTWACQRGCPTCYAGCGPSSRPSNGVHLSADGSRRPPRGPGFRSRIGLTRHQVQKTNPAVTRFYSARDCVDGHDFGRVAHEPFPVDISFRPLISRRCNRVQPCRTRSRPGRSKARCGGSRKCRPSAAGPCAVRIESP